MSDKTIFKLQVETTVVCYGDTDLFECFQERLMYGDRGVLLSLARLTRSSAQIESCAVDDAPRDNPEILRLTKDALESGPERFVLDFPPSEEAWADLDKAWGEFTLGDHKAEDACSSKDWLNLEHHRIRARARFGKVLSSPSTFPVIGAFETDSLQDRCNLVTHLYSKYFHAKSNLRQGADREEWENQLDYYFLRYPTLESVFKRMLANGASS